MAHGKGCKTKRGALRMRYFSRATQVGALK